MPANPLASLPEVFFSTTALSDVVARARAKGAVRQIGPRLYTKNLVDPPEHVIRRNLWPVVAAYAPGALIADRTALENAPASDGSVFVISNRKRDVELPGLTLRSRRGPEALDTDKPFIGGLRLSSQARAFLDNMVPSRRRSGDVSRTLSRPELETRLDDLVRRNGPEALNRLRDEARRIAPTLGRESELIDLDRLIGALLGTHNAPLETDRGRARGQGVPYDPDRMALFETLHAELRSTAPATRVTPERSPDGRATLAFFEAYFSNFIEGTEFDVAEAAAIVFDNVIPNARPADAHDVLGTWRIVSDPVEMSRRPRTVDDLSDRLRSRHAVLMAARPEKGPGRFKQETNRAGQTVFVAPDQVKGTLDAGFELYRSLDTPFARAVYMMFLVSEVHPFADGNGRIARIMMNAELVAEGEERIIIPTIFRSNYLSALKALSNTGNPRPLVRTLDFAQRWVLALPWRSIDDAQTKLTSVNAFMDPSEADDVGIRLQIYDGMS
ncbi:Fic family protein [Brevundimonas sp. TWP2-3-2]|uniref:Fic family protein n=1 Tax=unclassified Brevundimonas TaxID=2622653 RepID=UPI003CF9A827